MTYATASSEALIPIVNKLQDVLVGEDFATAVIAVLMLAVVMQRQDIEPEVLEKIIDEWSQQLQALFHLHDSSPTALVTDKSRMN